jgi:hypothetical protein
MMSKLELVGLRIAAYLEAIDLEIFDPVILDD